MLFSFPFRLQPPFVEVVCFAGGTVPVKRKQAHTSNLAKFLPEPGKDILLP